MDYDLAKWAANARKQAKLTQEELAEAIGFSGKGSISAIEKGRNKPTFDIMLRIAKICDYPLPYQNQLINNKAECIQVGGHNFGKVSYINALAGDNLPILSIENISPADLKKEFLLKVENNDLNDIGILKGDILIINSSLKPKHENIIIVQSASARNVIAQLSISLTNQFFLKYNRGNPEIMPEDASIIGVVTGLKRSYAA